MPLGAADPIPFEAHYSAAEFTLIRKGLVPEVMEDKWFIYHEGGSVFFHRSWTGAAVFRVDFQEGRDGFAVAGAVCAREIIEAGESAHQARIVAFLIGNLLLGRSLPFPVPEGTGTLPPGVLQHSVSGTAYPEIVHPMRRPWWMFWR